MTRKITVEYYVCRDPQLEKVTGEVNDLIKTGWKPLGGIHADDRLFMQAMVMEGEEICPD